MVNQKLALSPGAEPCSTIKLTVAMAALSEGLVTSDTPVKLAGFRMNMTQALAKSNNLYFEELGRELASSVCATTPISSVWVNWPATTSKANSWASIRIRNCPPPGRRWPHVQLWPGRFSHAAATGRFCSRHCQRRNPLLSAAPHYSGRGRALQPKVKRTLDIARYVPDLEDGMAGAVEYGTARRLRANFHELPVFGKTGTCSDNGTATAGLPPTPTHRKAVWSQSSSLKADAPPSPRAAELTGEFYKNLWDRNWFAAKGPQDAAAIPALSAQPMQP